jgi:hypothetical protein
VLLFFRLVKSRWTGSQDLSPTTRIASLFFPKRVDSKIEVLFNKERNNEK